MGYVCPAQFQAAQRCEPPRCDVSADFAFSFTSHLGAGAEQSPALPFARRLSPLPRVLTAPGETLVFLEGPPSPPRPVVELLCGGRARWPQFISRRLRYPGRARSAVLLQKSEFSLPHSRAEQNICAVTS